MKIFKLKFLEHFSLQNLSNKKIISQKKILKKTNFLKFHLNILVKGKKGFISRSFRLHFTRFMPFNLLSIMTINPSLFHKRHCNL